MPRTLLIFFLLLLPTELRDRGPHLAAAWVDGLECNTALGPEPLPKTLRGTSGVAIRTYDPLLLCRADALVRDGERTPWSHDLRPLGEAKGEAMAFTPGGQVILTSERGGADRPTLSRLVCTLPTAR